MDSKKTLRWTLYFTGGVLIALGLLSLLYPFETLLSLAFCLGIGLCLTGLNHLTPCFSLRGDPLRPRWLFLLGVLDLIAGAVMLARLGLTAFMIPIYTAAWMALTGAVRMGTSLRLRSVRVGGARLFPRWWLMLLSGLGLILCACAMFASPILAGLYVAYVIAASLIAAGLLIVAEGRWVFS